MHTLNVLKAMADESRLRIISALLSQPMCVEDLAQMLSLAESTVSAHLKKLQGAGLVYCTKQQYYSVYSVHTEILKMTLRDMLPSQQINEEERLAAYQKKVVNTFFEDGKLTRLPMQSKKRWAVYLEIIKLFTPGKTYTEKEINEIIQTVYGDYCIVRRELVDEGVLMRENGLYQLADNWQEKRGFYQRAWYGC